jgi:plastocyanin
VNRVLLAFILPLAMAAVSCASEERSGGAPFEVPGEPVKTNEVELPKSYKFEPAVVEVEAGTSITWTNNDNFPHNVHLLDGSDRTLDLPIGDSGSFSFDESGTIYYECSLHPQQMRGKIVVT